MALIRGTHIANSVRCGSSGVSWTAHICRAVESACDLGNRAAGTGVDGLDLGADVGRPPGASDNTHGRHRCSVDADHLHRWSRAPSVLLPPGWVRIPLDGSETARMTAIVTAEAADVPEPQRGQLRQRPWAYSRTRWAARATPAESTSCSAWVRCAACRSPPPAWSATWNGTRRRHWTACTPSWPAAAIRSPGPASPDRLRSRDSAPATPRPRSTSSPRCRAVPACSPCRSPRPRANHWPALCFCCSTRSRNRYGGSHDGVRAAADRRGLRRELD